LHQNALKSPAEKSYWRNATGTLEPRSPQKVEIKGYPDIHPLSANPKPPTTKPNLPALRHWLKFQAPRWV
jgi:hypothetical protein